MVRICLKGIRLGPENTKKLENQKKIYRKNQEYSVRPHSMVEKNEEVYGTLIEIFDRKLVLGEYLVGLSNSFSHHYL